MSPTKEKHLKTLELLFSRLQAHGLVVNEAKCSFCVNSLTFLGHEVSASGIAPSTAKVQAILDFQQPRTKKELHRYLGMYQFYGRFVPGSAHGCNPYIFLPLQRRITGHYHGIPASQNVSKTAKLLFLMPPHSLSQILWQARNS